MPGMVSWSLIATPRCCMYHATVPSGSGELITTCESDTGIDSSGSISLAVAALDVARHLEGAAVAVEEPEAVAGTARREVVRARR